MNKFSVIIPTLLKSFRIYKLLDDLQKCALVDEIIIIDNTGIFKSAHDKVRIVTKGKNIFVNPSWNWGVSLATNKNICICNDDVNFSTDIFEFAEESLKDGVIGMATDNYYIEGEKKIEPITERCWGWGCLFFVKKSDWIDIPDCLKIACGDDFLISKLPAYQMRGFKIDTEVSTTSLHPDFLEIQAQDKINFDKL